jgi:hypothetical protein
MNSWKDLPTTFVDDDDAGSDLISPLLLSSVPFLATAPTTAYRKIIEF